MKILVTGASGFLGSHVADALSAAGHDVVLYDLRESSFRAPCQELIVGDVLDHDSLCGAMKGCDAVYHLAAIADIGTASANPMQTVLVNIVGTSNALDCARQCGVERFVFASTVYVHSNHGSFYRTTKRCGEQLVEDYAERFGLPYTILRFGSLYGPRADEHNTIHRVIRQALNEQQIIYEGTGEEIREYIHVQDAAQAAVEILTDEFIDERVALTGHERMTSAKMLEMICEILNRKVEISYQPHTHTGHYVQTPYSYAPKLGKKLVRNTYIDIGLGLLDCIRSLDETSMEDEFPHLFGRERH
ncbi:MAG: NAD(P)-dependent oxidoreductase [Alphaproteobacteria bacterium]